MFDEVPREEVSKLVSRKRKRGQGRPTYKNGSGQQTNVMTPAVARVEPTVAKAVDATIERESNMTTPSAVSLLNEFPIDLSKLSFIEQLNHVLKLLQDDVRDSNGVLKGGMSHKIMTLAPSLRISNASLIQAQLKKLDLTKVMKVGGPNTQTAVTMVPTIVTLADIENLSKNRSGISAATEQPAEEVTSDVVSTELVVIDRVVADEATNDANIVSNQFVVDEPGVMSIEFTPSQIAEMMAVVRQLRERNDELEPAVKVFGKENEDLKAHVLEIKKELHAANDELDSMDTTRNRLQATIRELEDAVSSSKQTMAALQEEANTAKRKLVALASRQPSSEDVYAWFQSQLKP